MENKLPAHSLNGTKFPECADKCLYAEDSGIYDCDKVCPSKFIRN